MIRFLDLQTINEYYRQELVQALVSVLDSLTEAIHREVVFLPISQVMPMSEAARVAEVVNRYQQS